MTPLEAQISSLASSLSFLETLLTSKGSNNEEYLAGVEKLKFIINSIDQIINSSSSSSIYTHVECLSITARYIIPIFSTNSSILNLIPSKTLTSLATMFADSIHRQIDTIPSDLGSTLLTWTNTALSFATAQPLSTKIHSCEPIPHPSSWITSTIKSEPNPILPISSSSSSNFTSLSLNEDSQPIGLPPLRFFMILLSRSPISIFGHISYVSSCILEMISIPHFRPPIIESPNQLLATLHHAELVLDTLKSAKLPYTPFYFHTFRIQPLTSLFQKYPQSSLTKSFCQRLLIPSISLLVSSATIDLISTSFMQSIPSSFNQLSTIDIWLATLSSHQLSDKTSSSLLQLIESKEKNSTESSLCLTTILLFLSQSLRTEFFIPISRPSNSAELISSLNRLTRLLTLIARDIPSPLLSLIHNLLSSSLTYTEILLPLRLHPDSTVASSATDLWQAFSYFVSSSRSRSATRSMILSLLSSSHPQQKAKDLAMSEAIRLQPMLTAFPPSLPLVTCLLTEDPDESPFSSSCRSTLQKELSSILLQQILDPDQQDHEQVLESCLSMYRSSPFCYFSGSPPHTFSSCSITFEEFLTQPQKLIRASYSDLRSLVSALIESKLKLYTGSAAATFSSLQSLVSKWTTAKRSSPALVGTQAYLYTLQLCDFMTELEVGVAGSRSTFFVSNRGTCQKFFARIRKYLLTLSVQTGFLPQTLRQTELYLQEIDQSVESRLHSSDLASYQHAYEVCIVNLAIGFASQAQVSDLIGLYEWSKTLYKRPPFSMVSQPQFDDQAEGSSPPIYLYFPALIAQSKGFYEKALSLYFDVLESLASNSLRLTDLSPPSLKLIISQAAECICQLHDLATFQRLQALISGLSNKFSSSAGKAWRSVFEIPQDCLAFFELITVDSSEPTSTKALDTLSSWTSPASLIKYSLALSLTQQSSLIDEPALAFCLAHAQRSMGPELLIKGLFKQAEEIQSLSLDQTEPATSDAMSQNLNVLATLYSPSLLLLQVARRSRNWSLAEETLKQLQAHSLSLSPPERATISLESCLLGRVRQSSVVIDESKVLIDLATGAQAGSTSLQLEAIVKVSALLSVLGEDDEDDDGWEAGQLDSLRSFTASTQDGVCQTYIDANEAVPTEWAWDSLPLEGSLLRAASNIRPTQGVDPMKRWAGWCYRQSQRAIESDIVKDDDGLISLTSAEEARLAELTQKQSMDTDEELKLRLCFQNLLLEAPTIEGQLEWLQSRLAPSQRSAGTSLYFDIRQRILTPVFAAIEAYFRLFKATATSLVSGSEHIIGALRIIRLIVKYGRLVEPKIWPLISSAPASVWQETIPQLFGRLSEEREAKRRGSVVSRLVTAILLHYAGERPDAVIWTSLVHNYDDLISKLSSLGQSRLQPSIQSSRRLIAELKRIAQLRQEVWSNELSSAGSRIEDRFEAVEAEASRLEGSDLGSEVKVVLIRAKYELVLGSVISTIKSLRSSLNSVPRSELEARFVNKHGRYLAQACELVIWPLINLDDVGGSIRAGWSSLITWKSSMELTDLKPATSYRLSEISPTLRSADSDSGFTLPSRYHGSAVDEWESIASFGSQIEVVSSKTKPKKLSVRRLDGSKGWYLIKGKEDLNLDQRMSQLLGVINTLLAQETYKEDGVVARRGVSGSRVSPLSCRNYSVLPLGSNLGLVSWVDGSDPLYKIFKEWQSKNSSNSNESTATIDTTTTITTTLTADSVDKSVEESPSALARDIVRLRPSELFFKHLAPKLRAHGVTERQAGSRKSWPKPLLRELFTQLQEAMPSTIIRDELARHVGGSNEWYIKRKKYAESLAVNSMIGFVIGLGDRHLANILLDRQTGEVIHIDYNVCFDRGLKLKVPETVPFRLSQNLTSALGYSGVEGVFRLSAESTLRVLRKNKELLLMILEVFLYDPLEEWKEKKTKKETRSALLRHYLQSLLALLTLGQGGHRPALLISLQELRSRQNSLLAMKESTVNETAGLETLQKAEVSLASKKSLIKAIDEQISSTKELLATYSTLFENSQEQEEFTSDEMITVNSLIEKITDLLSNVTDQRLKSSLQKLGSLLSLLTSSKSSVISEIEELEQKRAETVSSADQFNSDQASLKGAAQKTLSCFSSVVDSSSDASTAVALCQLALYSVLNFGGETKKSATSSTITSWSTLLMDFVAYTNCFALFSQVCGAVNIPVPESMSEAPLTAVLDLLRQAESVYMQVRESSSSIVSTVESGVLARVHNEAERLRAQQQAFSSSPELETQIIDLIYGQELGSISEFSQLVSLLRSIECSATRVVEWLTDLLAQLSSQTQSFIQKERALVEMIDQLFDGLISSRLTQLANASLQSVVSQGLGLENADAVEAKIQSSIAGSESSLLGFQALKYQFESVISKQHQLGTRLAAAQRVELSLQEASKQLSWIQERTTRSYIHSACSLELVSACEDWMEDQLSLQQEAEGKAKELEAALEPLTELRIEQETKLNRCSAHVKEQLDAVRSGVELMIRGYAEFEEEQGDSDSEDEDEDDREYNSMTNSANDDASDEGLIRRAVQNFGIRLKQYEERTEFVVQSAQQIAQCGLKFLAGTKLSEEEVQGLNDTVIMHDTDKELDGETTFELEQEGLEFVDEDYYEAQQVGGLASLTRDLLSLVGGDKESPASHPSGSKKEKERQLKASQYMYSNPHSFVTYHLRGTRHRSRAGHGGGFGGVVLRKIKAKLDGRVNSQRRRVEVVEVVDSLINQARDEDRLAHMYEGWCAWI